MGWGILWKPMFRSGGDKIRLFNSHAAQSYSNNGKENGVSETLPVHM